MPSITIVKADEFIKRVKRSGLVDDERLTQAVSDLDPAASDSSVVRTNLVTAGLLTPWQGDRLLQGQCRGFFLGNYKILDRLGAGGMGAVYLAEHVIMRHRVAVKVLSRNVAGSSLLQRFHQEARAAAAFSHPNLVRAFDVNQAGQLHYLVMEYVEGSDLQALVRAQGPLPFREAAQYVRQAAEDLAHAGGLIHRDVKPANLLVDRAGVVKVLDLGLARLDDGATASLTVTFDEKQIGTVDYLAPEQAEDSHNIDARVDIYSLGCTLYFLLTGRPPFADGSIAQRIIRHQKAEPKSIREFRPDAPESLLAICKRMMAKSPGSRYQTMAAVSVALAAWLSGTDHAAATPTTHQSANKPAEEELTLALLDDDDDARPSARIIGPATASDSSKAALCAGGKEKTQAPKPASLSLIDEALEELASERRLYSLSLLAESTSQSPVNRPHPSQSTLNRSTKPVSESDEEEVYSPRFWVLGAAILAGLILSAGFICIKSFS